MSQAESQPPKISEEDLRTLIRANHILHQQHVVDAYGHISMRDPSYPSIFIMSASLAPALVSSPSDLVSYHVSDASPVDAGAKKGYQERFIHSEIYKRFEGVNSVVHSHSEAVLPFTVSAVPMAPTFHIAGFLGSHIPLFDLLQYYGKSDQQDMLINTTTFGAHLASSFSGPQEDDLPQKLEHNVVLIRNHGFTCVGNSVKQAVYRAVYTHINAGVQTNALLLRGAVGKESVGPSDTGLRYLNEKQVDGGMKMNDASQDRPWELWVREVEVCKLYRCDI